ncbi:hypothetical protein FACS1894189_8380 [Planctomycetales bacterium]|nr:hypothetical protein FACS1894189_8380 [Planctomycetales bacterium]
MVRFDKNSKCFFVESNETSSSGIATQTQISSIGERKFVNVSRYAETNKNINDDYEVISYVDAAKNPYSFEYSLAGYPGNTMLIFGIYSLGKEGYISHSIDSSLQGMVLNADQQEWQGHQVYRITGSNVKDRYELWLDPTLGFMPIRISYFCDPGIKRTKPDYFSFDLCVESYRQIDNVFIPEKYIINFDGSYQWYEKDVLRSIPTKEIYQGEFSKMSIPHSSSDKDFEITMPIPNYTEVFMQDAPQIQYTWLDGKIEPLTDELALARLRGHKFIPGVREPRFWFIASGIILISIALAGQLWKYFQNKKKKEDKFLS